MEGRAWWSVRSASTTDVAFVVMTEQGRAAIERAAPGHARTVRRLVLDQFSEDEVDTLGDVLATVLTQLSQRAARQEPPKPTELVTWAHEETV